MDRERIFTVVESGVEPRQVVLVQTVELRGALAQARVVADCVTPINGFSKVPDHSHGVGAGNARAFEVTDCRATKVMENAAGQTRASAGLPPRSIEALDRASVAVENPWDDRSRRLF